MNLVLDCREALVLFLNSKSLFFLSFFLTFLHFLFILFGIGIRRSRLVQSAGGATCGEFRGTWAREEWASQRRIPWRPGARKQTPFASPPRRRRREQAVSGSGNGTRRISVEGKRKETWDVWNRTPAAHLDTFRTCTQIRLILHGLFWI